MVNQQKSKCQLRLEARSRHACCTPASDLAAQLQSRIARAAEVRALRTRQLSARARARVQHAQDVARGVRVKRHEETRLSRQFSVSKLDKAARRRHEQLEQLQLQCKQRADLISEKVELVRADQSDRAARARRALAGQLDDAARRRELQTQQRVRRLSERWQSVESVKDRVARAKFIQRWFRRQVASRKAATALRQVQQDVAKVVKCWGQMANASFEECMRLLQQRPVVQAAQRLLKVLTAEEVGKVATPPLPVSPNGGGMSFRVLMLAGMISIHPKEIMGQDPSTRLHYAASVILSEMRSLSQCLKVAGDGFQRTRELTKCVSRLSARFAFYIEAFARWKARDAERLANELLASYRELLLVQRKYEAQAQEAQNGVDGVHELLRQTQGQLVQMQRALEKLLGRDGAKRKVEELEQTFKQEQEAAAESVGAGAGASGSGAGGGNNDGSSDTTSSSSLPMDTGGEGDDDKKGDDDEEMQSGDEPESKASSRVPPSVNQALLADRKLVHELILNPQFQIPRDKDVEASAAVIASEQSVAAMAVRVREAMTKAFWDRIIEANDVETLLARTDELRTTFREALGGGSGAGLGPGLSALADQVDSALRPDQWRELMQDPMRNVHVIQARCNGVLDAIERAEAPARAETTRGFRSDWAQRIAAGVMTLVQLLVSFLAFALDKVDELRSDVLNAHLSLLGAYLQRHGIEYEQRQLQERLSEAGSVEKGFPLTVKWLGMEMEAYVARSEIDEAECSRLARYDGAAFERFVRASVWSLVEKHIDGTAPHVWPETFELDIPRIRACRDELDRIAIVSSLLALVQEYVARRSLNTPPGFFHAAGQQLSTLLRSHGVSGVQLAAQAIQDVRQLESLGNEDVQQELEALEKRLLGSFAADNAVFKLFFSRAARAFECALFSKGNRSEELHPSLAPFAAEITEATSVLRRLVKHNESVYASLYNSIIKTLVAAL